MFKFRRFNKSDEVLWDNFVFKSNNGTIFHQRLFLNYHPINRFKDHSLIIEKKQKLFSVLPAVEKKIKNKKYLISHPGSSIGSFVVPENLSILDSLGMVKHLLYYARNLNFDRIEIKLPPNLYQKRLSNYMDFAFFKYNFNYKNRDVTSILFLEKTIEKNILKFRSSHKRGVNIAKKKGVVITESEEFNNYYKILKKNLSKRHGVNPTHSLEELKKLKSIFKDKIRLFAAFVDNKMVAGVINFIVNEHVILAFYISHDEAYNEYRPLNLLFYEIFSWAIKHKYKIYDFGTFTVNQEPNLGLGRFKENFGASGIFRDTIHLNLK